MDAETHWNKFIERLEEVQPLVFHKKDGEYRLPHVSFLGSIEAYKKIYMEANKETE